MNKIDYHIKLMLCLIFIIYIFLQGTLTFRKSTDRLLAGSLDKIPSEKKNRSFDYIVTGGSNALLGISAQRITQKTGLSGFNLAISAAEGAGLLNYPEWLQTTRSTAKNIIYSSMNFWYLGKNAPFQMLPINPKPNTSKHPIIDTPIIRIISNMLKNSNININQYGDMTVLECESQIAFLEPNYVDSHDIDSARIQKFIDTIYAMKNALNAEEILLRIPPIYISRQSKPAFEHYLSYIRTVFTNHGFIVLGSDQALTTDATKMCFDANHPTSEARDEYTDALIHELFTVKELVFEK